MNISATIISLALSMLLISCASKPIITENPVAAELAPMEQPPAVSRRVYRIDKLTGAEESIEYTNISADGAFVGTNSSGCTWENQGDLVSPATSWSNCGGSGEWKSGKNVNIKKKGALWPLVVGNKVTYTYNQVNAFGKQQPKTKMSCKVAGVANIDVAAGNVDVYKVECLRRKDTWSLTRIFYFSPEMNEEVKFVRSTSDDGVTRNVEALRVEYL